MSPVIISIILSYTLSGSHSLTFLQEPLNQQRSQVDSCREPELLRWVRGCYPCTALSDQMLEVWQRPDELRHKVNREFSKAIAIFSIANVKIVKQVWIVP